MKEQTCAQLVERKWADRKGTLEAYMAMRNPNDGDDERGPFSEWALWFDYVLPYTWSDQPRGYWRYGISTGGPSDEIRFYGNLNTFTDAEYRYHDWYDGAGLDVSKEPCIVWLWQQLQMTGAVAQAKREAY